MSDSVKSGLSNRFVGEAEETLRLLARLPAPEGLEERVQAGLSAAPRRARVLAWPVSASGGWLRSAAAAGIVFVVAGGGWSVYSHVQPRPQMGGFVSPSAGAPSGFKTGGDVERPKTVNGPIVAHPSVDQPAPAKALARPSHAAGSAPLRKARSVPQTGAVSVPEPAVQ